MCSYSEGLWLDTKCEDYNLTASCYFLFQPSSTLFIQALKLLSLCLTAWRRSIFCCFFVIVTVLGPVELESVYLVLESENWIFWYLRRWEMKESFVKPNQESSHFFSELKVTTWQTPFSTFKQGSCYWNNNLYNKCDLWWIYKIYTVSFYIRIIVNTLKM